MRKESKLLLLLDHLLLRRFFSVVIGVYWLLVMRNAGGWYSFSFLSYIPPSFYPLLLMAVLHHPTQHTILTDYMIDSSYSSSSQRSDPHRDELLKFPGRLLSFFFLLLLSFAPHCWWWWWWWNEHYGGLPSFSSQPLPAHGFLIHIAGTGERAAHVCICCSDTWMEVQSVGCCCPSRCFHYTWIDTLLLCEFLFSSPLLYRPPKQMIYDGGGPVAAAI